MNAGIVILISLAEVVLSGVQNYIAKREPVDAKRWHYGCECLADYPLSHCFNRCVEDVGYAR